MTTFCPHCWAESPSAAQNCPTCGADLREGPSDYLTKLIAALRHPEPLTQRRAAYILGLLRHPAAIEPLADVLAGDADPYVKGEAAHALAAIGGERARAVLEETAQNEAQSVMVRHVAAEAGE